MTRPKRSVSTREELIAALEARVQEISLAQHVLDRERSMIRHVMVQLRIGVMTPEAAVAELRAKRCGGIRIGPLPELSHQDEVPRRV